jgi:hypothetical protein
LMNTRNTIQFMEHAVTHLVLVPVLIILILLLTLVLDPYLAEALVGSADAVLNSIAPSS